MPQQGNPLSGVVRLGPGELLEPVCPELDCPCLLYTSGNDEWSNYSFLFIRDSIGFLDVVESAAKKIGVPYKFAPVCYDDHLYDILHPLFSDAYAIEAYMLSLIHISPQRAGSGHHRQQRGSSRDPDGKRAGIRQERRRRPL